MLPANGAGNRAAKLAERHIPRFLSRRSGTSPSFGIEKGAPNCAGASSITDGAVTQALDWIKNGLGVSRFRTFRFVDTEARPLSDSH